MVEPVAAQDIMLATMAGALVILTGALYAGLFAWSRVSRLPALLPLSYLAYAALAACVYVLAISLHLTGTWISVVVVMLIGYLLAPHAIWHLCEGTHEAEVGETHGLKAGGPES